MICSSAFKILYSYQAHFTVYGFHNAAFYGEAIKPTMESTHNLVANLVQLNQLAIYTMYLNTAFYKI
jgi:hypothetical protein